MLFGKIQHLTLIGREGQRGIEGVAGGILRHGEAVVGSLGAVTGQKNDCRCAVSSGEHILRIIIGRELTDLIAVRQLIDVGEADRQAVAGNFSTEEAALADIAVKLAVEACHVAVDLHAPHAEGVQNADGLLPCVGSGRNGSTHQTAERREDGVQAPHGDLFGLFVQRKGFIIVFQKDAAFLSDGNRQFMLCFFQLGDGAESRFKIGGILIGLALLGDKIGQTELPVDHAGISVCHCRQTQHQNEQRR